MFALIDEIIDAFDADAIHGGMDEVFLVGHEASPDWPPLAANAGLVRGGEAAR